MIAVGANVLLRYLLRDDQAQAERACRVFQRGERMTIRNDTTGNMEAQFEPGLGDRVLAKRLGLPG